MPKAKNKTVQNELSVEDFIAYQKNDSEKADCLTIIDMMSKASGEKPKMWGPSIVGFGKFPMKYASGRELDWFYCGFSPRKDKLTLYFMDGLENKQALLDKLGKHSIGKSCLYVKRLADLDLKVLRKMVDQSVAHMRKQFGAK